MELTNRRKLAIGIGLLVIAGMAVFIKFESISGWIEDRYQSYQLKKEAIETIDRYYPRNANE